MNPLKSVVQIRGIIAAARSLCIVSTIIEVVNRLKEILGAPASGGGDSTLVVRHGREDREAWVQVLAKVHDGGDVAAAVAVVWGTPHCDDGFVFEVPLRGEISSAKSLRHRR